MSLKMGWAKMLGESILKGIISRGARSHSTSDCNNLSTFLKQGSYEELKSAREKIRQDFCNPTLDNRYREECRRKLDRFDAELSKRAWGNETPRPPSYHREHGYYLPNDD